MTDDVYVHIGLPKTGTTYLQRTLWDSRDDLAAAGVLVPGANHRAQRLAFWDLLGRRLRGVDQPRVPGSWRSLVDTVHGWSGPQVVLSDEFLVHARPRQVRRMVRDLAPARVHVVVTVRDLARVVSSMWQQEVSKGRTWPWPEFVAAVRDPEHGPATAGVAFWLRHDVRKVLGGWDRAVPPERIHVVVVPPPGTPPEVLLDRFITAARLDRRHLTPAPREVNTSVGMAETELLRRLNERLEGRLNERQYLHVVRQAVKPALRAHTDDERVTLPASEHEWVTERCRELVELLKNAPYDVVGPLEDLLPSSAPPPGAGGAAADADVADAAVAALTATFEQYAGLWWRSRSRRRTSKASRGARVASAGRALAFGAKVRGLEKADSNRLLARAARLYLRGSRRPRPRR